MHRANMLLNVLLIGTVRSLVRVLLHLPRWAFVGLLFFFGCDSVETCDCGPRTFTARETFSFEVAVENQHRIRLETINGNVEINGKSGARSVIVTGERLVESSSLRDAEDHLDEIAVQVRDLGEEVFVRTEQPRHSQGRSYIVHYTITVPKDLEVDVRHFNGNIAVEAIENHVSVENFNGNVLLGHIVGNASVQVFNGNIDSDVTLPRDGTIKLTTNNGNIDLAIPTSTSATLAASVLNGLIHTSNLTLHDQSDSPRSLDGTLGEGEGAIELTTLNGIISVTGRH